jgi:phage terminase large subunit GpA-like protein
LRLFRPDVWASQLRLQVGGHAFSLEGREYERAILRDESPWIVIPKGAQLGLTTVFLIRSCHWATHRRWHHLYLLPLKTGAVQFVQGRLDPIIDSNPGLKSEFQRVENRTHKQTQGGVNW